MHRYFQPQTWERNGAFYELFGVRKARPFVSGGSFWQRIGLASRRPSWRRSNVKSYIRQSIYAEIAHSASFAFMVVIAAIFIFKNSPIEAGIVSIANFLLNLVPVAVLRYNRLRILRHRSASK